MAKEAFVGTGTVSAVIVDSVRLVVYGLSFYASQWAAVKSDVGGLVIAAIISAFVGAYLAARLLKKVTLRFVQLIVASVMVLVGAGLAAGLL